VGNSFFDGWDFFTGGDPTHGYVNYVDKATAQRLGYTRVNGNSVYIGSDMHNVVNNSRGRDSVRLTSKSSWQKGLFIMDATHMPSGCGTWPAWWLVGPNWPNKGEIDIIEGVNSNNVDATTLHTSSGCDMSGQDTSKFSGKWGTDRGGKPATNCYVNAPNEFANQGCGITGGAYGPSFNSGNGGVYALEWTDGFIRAFYFPRNSIPQDLQSGNPNPDSWGKPYALFDLGNNCPDVHFEDEQIVINLTFCGDWAGNVFGSQCPGLGDCKTFVQKNPSKFSEAYWAINYVAVFQ